MRSDFVVFILSHGRPKKVKTLEPLLKAGKYSGKWYIVIDDEDEKADEYVSRFGTEHIKSFSRQEMADQCDVADMDPNYNTVLFARNKCFALAEELNAKYFLELDDDYNSFEFRVAENGKLKTYNSHNLDRVFSAFVDFLEQSGAVSVAMAQGGDMIGGCDGFVSKCIHRKAMNTFFCSVERPFLFCGRMNDDVNTYTTLSSRGNLFMTVPLIMIQQARTQKNKGGLTELYLEKGTYAKSFYTVMMLPSAVKISTLGHGERRRIHHLINGDHCYPCIISETFRK